MPKQVVPIRTSPKPEIPRPEDAERHQRVIGIIGGQRIALDFWSRATQLNPVDAEIVPMPEKPTGKRRHLLTARLGQS